MVYHEMMKNAPISYGNSLICFSYHSQVSQINPLKMKISILSALLILIRIPLIAQTSNEQLTVLQRNFLSTDWPSVLNAKEMIENLGPAGIQNVIAMLDNCAIHKLRNTGDLIYPGAERFFGHGQIIEYDIDFVCVRAGWFLEELTFMNFGFSGIHLPDDEMAVFIKRNFPDYMAVEANRLKVDSLDEAGRSNLIRTLSIEKAKTWWLSSSKQWSRLNALEQALKSNDEKSQVKALFYMRNGATACKGLTEKFYKSRLSKVVETLSKSKTGRVSENAKLIMLDSGFAWLKMKPSN